MNIRALASALATTLLLGTAAHATAQGFTSISSLPAPAAAGAPVAPATTTRAAAATPAFSSVSSQPTTAGEGTSAETAPGSVDASRSETQPVSTTPVPPAAATLAFSSVSSQTDGLGAGAAGSGPSLPAPASSTLMAERIVIEKGARRLYLFSRGRVIAEYPVKLGLSPRGHKQYEGDFRTPEGVYYLSRRNPNSEFYLSVEVSYPNEADRARAQAEGVRPGGLIMIHGQPNVPKKPPEYYANTDWTDGCIAVSNAHMAEIWRRTRVGIPIEIRP